MEFTATIRRMTVKKEIKIFDRIDKFILEKKSIKRFMYFGIGSVDVSSIFIVSPYDFFTLRLCSKLLGWKTGILFKNGTEIM